MYAVIEEPAGSIPRADERTILKMETADSSETLINFCYTNTTSQSGRRRVLQTQNRQTPVLQQEHTNEHLYTTSHTKIVGWADSSSKEFHQMT